MGTATEFAKLLKKEGKSKSFNDVVKVQIGQVKKYLGEDILEGFVTSETEKYGSVSFKKV
jgi:hypothetical protein